MQHPRLYRTSPVLTCTLLPRVQVDLAFAQAEHPPTSGTGSLATRFYLPLATYEDGAQRFELADPRQVTFSGGLEFSHFAGATKN